ncbi:MAG: hypothetical protein FWE23_04545 [Chitinivibrionia bacterium]|nr:hypothetical protein [Chitinivibrionia bacterium]
MNASSQNSKKIVKNTLALYFRQIITMLVMLFTSRIILQTLGVTDFGISNVVGSVVAMFVVFSNTLTVITQRFITVELGNGGNSVNLQKIFSTSIILQIAIAIIVVILSQTVGLWFLNNKLNIPAERLLAANWVYQFAVLSFLLSLLNSTFTALIVSHEDMHIYGFVGIFDAVLRLGTVYLLVIADADKLILFGMLGFAASCAMSLFYFVYCRKKYSDTKFSLAFDKSLFKEFGGYGKHVFISSVFMVLNIYGIGIMLNMFFGPAINAAKGIATTVNTALSSLGNSFKQSLSPQLMKAYAQKNCEYMWDLSARGTRFMFFLFFVFSVPLLLETEFLLKLWLGEVPEYTAIFARLIIIFSLLNVLIYTMDSINHATGKIGAYSSVGYVGSALELLFAYFFLKAGFAPYFAFVAPILLFPICITAQCMVMKKQVGFSIKHFTQKALIPIFLVSMLSFLPFYFVNKLFLQSFWQSWIVLLTSVLWTGFVILFVGLKNDERVKIYAFVKRKVGQVL